jgi:hypothetical protein
VEELECRVWRSKLVVPALAAAALLSLAQILLAAPDLSGSWRFVAERSDPVREKIVAALGGAYSQGDVREDAARVWIRSWLLQQAQEPAARVLSIEQNATELRSGLADDIRIYYFGRDTTRQGPGGGLRKASVRQEGARLIVEEKAVKGSGHIVETYELQPDGRTLLVTWRLEHKALHQPLELKLLFEKVQP